jgi:holo-[acyl-carrier protein] synthase
VETVIEIISVIAGKERSQLAPDSNLRSLGITSSIEILKIQSALERKFNQKLPPLGDTWTIDKIASQVGQGIGENAAIATPMQLKIEDNQGAFSEIPERSSTPGFSGFFIGIDIEEVEHLPLTSNFRTHDFYQTQFRNEEISYALLKPEPRLHLCGIFCAKEALKKSAPELIQLRMDEIQIHHLQGRPYIQTIHESINARFNFQVSISHSNHYAVAAVFTIAR